LGEITSSLAQIISRRRLAEAAAEMERFKELSERALKAGDGTSYRAANKLANEAFGKNFFLNAALSASLLWPVFFTMAWMETRFSEIEFHAPFVNESVGWPLVFVLCYIAAYILFRPLKWRLPFFSWVKRMLDSSEADRSAPALNRDENT
jgi:hypothetical protein